MAIPKPNPDDKLSYEILDLENKTSPAGRFATYIWPMVSSLATLLLTLVVAIVSLHTQSRQATIEERQKEYEQTLKRKELLDEALKLATDGSAGQDRRIAGIRSLTQFWSQQEYEEIVASTLVAELGLDDKDRFARCAAADVLGEATYGPDSYFGGKNDKRSARIARLLFGYSPKGEIGLVGRENKLLQAVRKRGEEESDTDPCLTAIGASREAVRSNWSYLRDANLNETDLVGTRLYEADMAGASFVMADIDAVDFKCTNLYGADFGQSGLWTKFVRVTTPPLGLSLPDFAYANIKDVKPRELATWIKTKFTAVEMEDAVWQSWRKNGFRVDVAGRPVLDPKQNVETDSYPCGR